MRIKKDDYVKVLLGKDRGREGKVLRVFAKKGQVLVEGVNIVKRHLKKRGQSEGGIIEITKPLDISNVVLVCPNCKKATRIGYKIQGETKARVCRKCQEKVS